MTEGGGTTAGRVEIAVLTEAERAQKGLQQIIATLGEMQTSLNQVVQSARGIESATGGLREHGRVQKAVSTSSRNLLGQIAKLTAAFFALRRMVMWVGQAFKSAMDYEEVVNLFQTVFRKLGLEMGDEFEFAFLERASTFSRRLADQFILDPRMLMDQQARFAQMADSMGLVQESSYLISEALTALAIDFASLRNVVNIDDAMGKLQSGIAGQIRPLRQWGLDISKTSLQLIALKHGITDSFEKMSAAAKVQLRFLAIMEQSRVAMGDMPRTFEAPANQLRILRQQWALWSRELGNVFMPIIKEVLPWLNAVMLVLTRLTRQLALLLGFEEPDYTHTEIYLGLDTMADDFEEAEDAAKSLRNVLFGFDELNIAPAPAGVGSDDRLGSGYAALDEAIMREHEGYMNRLNEETEKMSQRVKELADQIEPLVRKVLKWVGGLLALWLAFKMAKSAWAAIKGIAAAFGVIKGIAAVAVAKISLPVAAAIAAVAALIGIFYRLWTTNEDFRNNVTSAFEKVRDVVVVSVDIIKEKVSEGLDWIRAFWDEWGEDIVSKIKDAMNRVWGIISKALELILLVWNTQIEILKAVWDKWGDEITAVWTVVWGGVKNLLVTTWEVIKSTISGTLDVIEGVLDVFIGAFTGDWERMWNGITRIVKGAANSLIGFINAIIGAAERMVNAIADGINAIPSIKIPDWMGGGEFGIPHVRRASFPRVPYLAEGTNLIPEDMLAFLHKGEAVVPKKFNPAALPNVPGGVADMSGGYGGRFNSGAARVARESSRALTDGLTIVNPVYIGNDKVAEHIYRKGERKNIRAGQVVNSLGVV